MKKSKICSLILLLVTCFCTMAAAMVEPDEPYGALGRLSKLNVTDDELNELLVDINAADKFTTKFIFYDSLNNMLMALNNGDIAAFTIDTFTADYVASRNDKFVVRKPSRETIDVPFSMLLREEDSELCSRISEVIKEMKADGSIDALKKEYIDDCIAGNDPAPIKPSHFEGAQTIRVAVTGDRPPMDYISTAGEPMGFNTALIAEIASRLGLNVEIIGVEAPARGISLATGAADVVFWMEKVNYGNYEGSDDREDQPDNTVVTENYLSSPNTYVVLANSPIADALDLP